MVSSSFMLMFGINLAIRSDNIVKSIWDSVALFYMQFQGAQVLRPRNSKLVATVHFVGGIFVGTAPQLTHRLFLERLSEKGVLVIATPYASGFDDFFIADEVQFKYDRFNVDPHDLPFFGIGHSLGSVNNKDASMIVPLFSHVLLPMAQSTGPILSQIASSLTVRFRVELESNKLSPTSHDLHVVDPSISSSHLQSASKEIERDLF
ncbi:hypothetical protein L1987_78192 [Smallanthus sonchifolius]|uniref:Uncharacterized protein n=1 Tax=Smallanthus sonchifolius TaxID=185202 RepID=A0ACB8ZC78_9ASTR|nr:hypothetical protein L1987_78192 [Smallanthus sonchifolius]